LQVFPNMLHDLLFYATFGMDQIINTRGYFTNHW